MSSSSTMSSSSSKHMDIDYGLDMQTQANIDKMTDKISKYYNEFYEIDVKPDISLLKDDVVKPLKVKRSIGQKQSMQFSPPPPPSLPGIFELI